MCLMPPSLQFEQLSPLLVHAHSLQPVTFCAYEVLSLHSFRICYECVSLVSSSTSPSLAPPHSKITTLPSGTSLFLWEH